MSLQHTEFISTKTEYHSIHMKKITFLHKYSTTLHTEWPLYTILNFLQNMNTECVLTLRLCVITPNMLPCPHALNFRRVFLQEIRVQI